LRAFTLIEALAAVLILSVGISAAVTTLGAIAKAQTRAIEREEMQRLAFRKYDEIVALDELPSGQSQGGFEAIGEERFVWRAQRSGTGDGNLDSIRVEVGRKGQGFQNAVEIQGLYCRPGASQ